MPHMRPQPITIRTLVVDDDDSYRLLLRVWMEQYRPTPFEVVGEAADGAQCLDLIRSLEPELVLIDLTMPRTDTFAIIDEIVISHPDIEVVVISAHDAELVGHRAVAHGARAYLEKETDGDRFRAVLEEVLRSDQPIIRSA